jgi:CTLH/CRA C-terminal to LisH motif domain
LRVQEFISCIEKNDAAGAIKYSKENLQKFDKEQFQTIQRAMGLLMFKGEERV